jgi:PAS domain-containing protein
MVVTTNTMQDVSSENFAEEKFRLAVEGWLSGMVMTDGAARIVLVTTEAVRMFGYQRSGMTAVHDLLMLKSTRDPMEAV